jgi:hypothetical protein
MLCPPSNGRFVPTGDIWRPASVEDSCSLSTPMAGIVCLIVSVVRFALLIPQPFAGIITDERFPVPIPLRINEVDRFFSARSFEISTHDCALSRGKRRRRLR